MNAHPLSTKNRRFYYRVFDKQSELYQTGEISFKTDICYYLLFKNNKYLLFTKRLLTSKMIIKIETEGGRNTK